MTVALLACAAFALASAQDVVVWDVPSRTYQATDLQATLVQVT
jgi:hypothetical protein